LKRPEIWSRVQASPRALRKFDRVTLVDFGELWLCEALVGAADQHQAVLARLKITALAQRFVPLPEDEKYRVEWTGTGFSVIRKADGQSMSVPAPTPEAAAVELARLYPRSAA
jgi:hypothetical protein